MNRWLSLSIALVCAGWAHDAKAEVSQAREDLRCLIVAMKLSQSSDQNVHSVGLIATMYWFGRADSYDLGSDLEDQIIYELKKMTQETFRSEATRCGAELTARGKALSEMGEDMVKRGEKMLDQEQSQ